MSGLSKVCYQNTFVRAVHLCHVIVQLFYVTIHLIGLSAHHSHQLNYRVRASES